MLADSRLRFQMPGAFFVQMEWNARLRYGKPRVSLSFYHGPKGHLMEEVNRSDESVK